jgi:S-formylglutathione hydrolase FrmB
MMPVRVPIEAKSDRVFPGPLKGRTEWATFRSQVLEGNPLRDPVERELPIYLPPSGKTDGLPLLVLLSGYTGAGPYHFQRPRFLSETHVGRLDRLIRTGGCPEAVLVGPDCQTSLGASQYLNSSATGRYEDYVVREIVPWVRERYRTGPVGVLGTSSGGFGALSLAMRHPEVFRGAASNAGDCYFELTYLRDFVSAVREIRKAGGPEALLRRVLSAPVADFGPHNPLIQAFEIMAYAACYSPVDSLPGHFELPFDLETGRYRDDIWARWLAHDPVRMVGTEPFRSAARQLAYLYVDGGTRDEWGLDLGARAFAAAARSNGVRVDHEEYDAAHFDAGPRYDVMYPRLIRALVGDGGGPGSGPV